MQGDSRMIPTRRMCEQLWADRKLSDDLKDHLTAVADLSVRIGAALNQKGFSLNVPLIEAAALLHDICKGMPHHEKKGAETLEALGFTEIAPIVRTHMRLSRSFEVKINELTVVFLADKLFIGSKAVTLEKRYAEKMLLYQDNPKVLRIIRDQLEISRKLEKQMKTVLGIDSLTFLPKIGESYETD